MQKPTARCNKSIFFLTNLLKGYMQNICRVSFIIKKKKKAALQVKSDKNWEVRFICWNLPVAVANDLGSLLCEIMSHTCCFAHWKKWDRVTKPNLVVALITRICMDKTKPRLPHSVSSHQSLWPRLTVGKVKSSLLLTTVNNSSPFYCHNKYMHLRF